MPFPFGPSLPGKRNIEFSKVPTKNPFIYTIKFGVFDQDTLDLQEERIVRIGFDSPVSGNEAINRFTELFEDTFVGMYGVEVGDLNLVVANATVEGPVLENVERSGR